MRNVTREMSRHSCLQTSAYLLLLLAMSSAAPATSFAKDPPLAAIVLFDAPAGPGYVQLTGVTLNMKTELRVCDGTGRIDKRSYDLLGHVQIKSGSALERGTDGVMVLIAEGAKPICVVPGSLRF